MTSLERKTRAVNSTDIASQFANTLGKDTPVKKLKSKNSELLSKYREKLKGESDTAELENEKINSEAEDDQPGRSLPKVQGSFKGINFDEQEEESSENPRQENKKRTWRKGKNFGPKKNFQNDNNKNSGKKRFKPFNRNNKKYPPKERF